MNEPRISRITRIKTLPSVPSAIRGKDLLERAAHSALLRKFTELVFDESAEMCWQESRPMEADNMDVGPAAATDLQGDLMEASGNPS